jgi:hypothetical protein
MERYKIEAISNGYLLYFNMSLRPIYFKNMEEVLQHIQHNEKIIEQQKQF